MDRKHTHILIVAISILSLRSIGVAAEKGKQAEAEMHHPRGWHSPCPGEIPSKGAPLTISSVVIRAMKPVDTQKKKLSVPERSSTFMVLAGSMRFVVEFWRANPIVALGMTEYQWISLVLVILGAGLFCYHWNRADQTAAKI